MRSIRLRVGLKMGFAPILIVLIIAGTLGVGFGGYEGVNYVQAKNLIKEGDKLMQSHNYEAAIAKYKKAGQKFKSVQKKIAPQIDLATKKQKEDEKIKLAQTSFDQSDWQKCLDSLKDIKSDNPKYEISVKMTGECQQKLDEATKAAADVKAETDTKAKEQTASKSKTNTKTNSNPNSNPNPDSSSGPSIGQVADTQSSSSSSSDSSSSSSSEETAAAEPEPVISNLGLTGFAAYDAGTGKAGPINFRVQYNDSDDYLRSQYVDENTPQAFYPFGASLPNHTVLNPTLEFHYITPATPVYAAMSGVVTSVGTQQNNDWGTAVTDYELSIGSSASSKWMIGYDHIQNLTVSQGDTVTVGQQIATTGANGNGYDRFELQIHNTSDMSNQYDICPLSLLDNSVKSSLTNSISLLQSDLNTYLGTSPYNLSAQNPAGCLTDVLR